MRYYKCDSENSTATNNLLKSCIVKCKKGLKNCTRFETEQRGVIFSYPEDRRTWFQKHFIAMFLFILSSFIIPIFLF